MSLSSQRYVSTSIWDEDWFYDLEPIEQRAFMYLLTGRQSNAAGVYECTLSRMARDLKASKQDVQGWISDFADIGKAYHIDGFVIIPWLPTDQRWSERNKINEGIRRTLKALPEAIIATLKDCNYEYPLDTLFLPDYPEEKQETDDDNVQYVGAGNSGMLRHVAPNGAERREIAPTGANPSSLDLDSDLDLDFNLVKPNINNTPKPYGSHVKLTDEAMKRLTDRWPKQTVFDYIERVNDYCASKGKRYKNHEATIRNWLKNGKVPEMGTGPPERHSAQPIINTQSLGGKHASASRTPVDGEITSRPEAVLRNANQPKASG